MTTNNPEIIRRKAAQQYGKAQASELHRVLAENRLFRDVLKLADDRLGELGDTKAHPIRDMLFKALEGKL